MQGQEEVDPLVVVVHAATPDLPAPLPNLVSHDNRPRPDPSNNRRAAVF